MIYLFYGLVKIENVIRFDPMIRLLIIVLFLFGHVSAQSPEKIKVYLLGTFHFSETDTTVFDIKSERQQKSVQLLTSAIAGFKPDRVFIERQPDFESTNKMDSMFGAFCKGDSIRRRNEIWQVAFRVAARLKHPHIYQCDHPGNYGNLYGEIEEYAKSNNQMNILECQAKGTTAPPDILSNRDSLFRNNELLGILKVFNTKKYQDASHAFYINVFPQLGHTNVYEYKDNHLLGSDLTVDWYRRNIKIYTKMINQLDYSEKAIFLIIGNDHIPILRHLFESNPYFEVIDTEHWLGSIKL